MSKSGPPWGLSVSTMGVPYDSSFNHLGLKAAHTGSSMTQSHSVLGPVLGKTKARAIPPSSCPQGTWIVRYSDAGFPTKLQ